MGIADYFFFLVSVFPLWMKWSWGIPLTILNFCSLSNSIEIEFLALRSSNGVLVPGTSQQVEAEFHWWLGNRATFSLHFPPHYSFFCPHFVSNLRVPDSSTGPTWSRIPKMQSCRKENEFPVLIITKVTCFAFLFSSFFFFPLFLKVKVSWSILT